jgi:hypothetical protein
LWREFEKSRPSGFREADFIAFYCYWCATGGTRGRIGLGGRALWLDAVRANRRAMML